MRSNLAAALTAFLLTYTNSGCGTLFNLSGHEVYLGPFTPERRIVPFGGVDNDVRWMARFKDDPMPIGIVAPALDIPLSFVADILTFPWTAYQSLIVVGGQQPLQSCVPQVESRLPEERHPEQRVPEMIDGK
jgi:hypothetical protein